MWPSSTLSALLLLRLHAAGASQPPQPPPYTTAYPAEMNLWDVPPPPDMKVNLRPFRLATRGTVTAVFFCLAWRATSLAERARDYQAPLGWLAKPFFVANVGAAMLAARHANRQKVLLKGVLHADVALEGLTLASSALRAGFPSSDQLLPADVHVVNALCAFWVGLVALSCSRSKWIELPPPAARGSQYGYSGGG
uniref:DUF4149 domain-containing protein n=1 Tax=Pelagomonas calceolata TaxID=35677 RepID=A0A7S4A6F9_9STRA|mmetsp:Transcript_13292/g.39316  ORF Transcript_13292/g.39316 Transcript_13292/m.39316 type:complete len:195 (+) Transcript_13292:204-788(+)